MCVHNIQYYGLFTTQKVYIHNMCTQNACVCVLLCVVVLTHVFVLYVSLYCPHDTLHCTIGLRLSMQNLRPSHSLGPPAPERWARVSRVARHSPASRERRTASEKARLKTSHWRSRWSSSERRESSWDPCTIWWVPKHNSTTCLSLVKNRSVYIRNSVQNNYAVKCYFSNIFITVNVCTCP